MSPKFKVPEAKNGKQARTLIWEGIGYFFREHPLKMWPLLLLFFGSNTTAWYKALTDDTVDLRPISQTIFTPEDSISYDGVFGQGNWMVLINQAYAGEEARIDTNYTCFVVRHGSEYWLRIIYKPTNKGMETPAPWIEKIR